MRWSMSVWVRISSLMTAVARATFGSARPTKLTWLGISNPPCCGWSPEGCATATTDKREPASTTAALRKVPNFIIPPVNAGPLPAFLMLNIGLAADVAERHPDQEGIAALDVAGGLIVPSPGQANLDTIVVIGDADPVPNRIESVGGRERVLGAVGEVD